MSGFFARRILLLLPTMLVVVCLAFLLSQSVPGDQAEASLVLQGIQPDSKRASTEYARNYKQLGLDKPVFYMTILPSYYPKNRHSIISKEDRQLTDELLQFRIPFQYIAPYLKAKKNYISHASIIPHDTISNTFVRNLRFAADPDALKTLLPELHTQTSTSAQAAVLVRTISQMLDHRVDFFYPVLHWHGSANRFHEKLVGLCRGDLGTSIRDGLPVRDKISKALTWTGFLALTNILLSFLIAIPSGMYAGYHIDGKWDKMTHILWLWLYSMPVFWLASLLIIYFTTDRYGSWMSLFPLPGAWYIPSGQTFWQTLSLYAGQMVLPVICLIANDLAFLTRIVRNNTQVVKGKYFILTAIASGQSDKTIMKKHILPHILIPMITVLAGRLPSSVAGALIVEVIFGIPGMGRLLHLSISGEDWQVVMGILLFVSSISMIAMLLADIVQSWLNPRMKTAFV